MLNGLKKVLSGLLAFLLLCACAAHAVGATASAGLDERNRANIEAVAFALDGWVVGAGERFSFREVLGKCGPLGEGVDGRGDVVAGGGADAVASALYLALSKLPPGQVAFEELALYGDAYAGSYVPSGQQAVLVDEGCDMRFFNLSTGPMTISVSAQDAIDCTVYLDEAANSPQAFDRAALEPPSQQGFAPGASVTLTCEGGEAELSNIRLAADSVYDTTIPAGGVFSFNAALGPRAERYGYRLAADGTGAIVPAGGVDQVASALWLLIRDQADVAVVSKSVYEGYAGRYAASPADAIRTDEHTDFAFRYIGQGTLTLYTTLAGNVLTCELSREEP